MIEVLCLLLAVGCAWFSGMAVMRWDGAEAGRDARSWWRVANALALGAVLAAVGAYLA